MSLDGPKPLETPNCGGDRHKIGGVFGPHDISRVIAVKSAGPADKALKSGLFDLIGRIIRPQKATFYLAISLLWQFTSKMHLIGFAHYFFAIFSRGSAAADDENGESNAKMSTLLSAR